MKRGNGGESIYGPVFEGLLYGLFVTVRLSVASLTSYFPLCTLLIKLMNIYSKNCCVHCILLKLSAKGLKKNEILKSMTVGQNDVDFQQYLFALQNYVIAIVKRI